MVMEEAREVGWYGKAETVADCREALRTVGYGGNRLFQPLNVEEDPRRHAQ